MNYGQFKYLEMDQSGIWNNNNGGNKRDNFKRQRSFANLIKAAAEGQEGTEGLLQKHSLQDGEVFVLVCPACDQNVAIGAAIDKQHLDEAWEDNDMEIDEE